VDLDFIPGNFFSKNNKIKLLDNVLNISGIPNDSTFNIKKSHFFISFYEEEGSIKGASFGYSWMNPIDIADSFIGLPNDFAKRLISNCEHFRFESNYASFSYLFVSEIFEIKCKLIPKLANSNYPESVLVANVRNLTKPFESNRMYFRFVDRLESNEVSSRSFSN
jgi:hypothetical protein